jgi:hypothetical protein
MVKLQLVSLTPPSVEMREGTTQTMTVGLSESAPIAGVQVTLKNDNTSAATVPSVMTIAAGASTGTFPVVAASNLKIGENRTTTIHAELEGNSLPAAVTVRGPDVN